MVESNISNCEGVRKVLLSQGFDRDIVNDLMASWRKSRLSNYSSHINERFKFVSYDKALPADP